MGKSEADTAWVEADKIPTENLHVYEDETVEITTEQRCVSGQISVTAQSVVKSDSAVPPAKKAKSKQVDFRTPVGYTVRSSNVNL